MPAGFVGAGTGTRTIMPAQWPQDRPRRAGTESAALPTARAPRIAPAASWGPSRPTTPRRATPSRGTTEACDQLGVHRRGRGAHRPTTVMNVKLTIGAGRRGSGAAVLGEDSVGRGQVANFRVATFAVIATSAADGGRPGPGNPALEGLSLDGPWAGPGGRRPGEPTVDEHYVRRRGGANRRAVRDDRGHWLVGRQPPRRATWNGIKSNSRRRSSPYPGRHPGPRIAPSSRQRLWSPDGSRARDDVDDASGTVWGAAASTMGPWRPRGPRAASGLGAGPDGGPDVGRLGEEDGGRGEVG